MTRTACCSKWTRAGAVGRCAAEALLDQLQGITRPSPLIITRDGPPTPDRRNTHTVVCARGRTEWERLWRRGRGPSPCLRQASSSLPTLISRPYSRLPRRSVYRVPPGMYPLYPLCTTATWRPLRRGPCFPLARPRSRLSAKSWVRTIDDDIVIPLPPCVFRTSNTDRVCV